MAWLLDADEKDGMELAFGSLNARTRDYARFGWLYLNKGRSPLDGAQIVPEAWVRDSTTPDAPHLQPGRHDLHDYPFGYGYQWYAPILSKDSSPKLYFTTIFVSLYTHFFLPGGFQSRPNRSH